MVLGGGVEYLIYSFIRKIHMQIIYFSLLNFFLHWKKKNKHSGTEGRPKWRRAPTSPLHQAQSANPRPTNTLLGIPAQVLGLGPASKPGKAALGLILPQTQHGAEPSPIITGAKAPNSQQGKSNRSPLAAPR